MPGYFTCPHIPSIGIPFQFPSSPQVGVFVIYHYFPGVVSIFLTWGNGVPVFGKLADDPAPGFLLESVS